MSNIDYVIPYTLANKIRNTLLLYIDKEILAIKRKNHHHPYIKNNHIKSQSIEFIQEFSYKNKENISILFKSPASTRDTSCKKLEKNNSKKSVRRSSFFIKEKMYHIHSQKKISRTLMIRKKIKKDKKFLINLCNNLKKKPSPPTQKKNFRKRSSININMTRNFERNFSYSKKLEEIEEKGEFSKFVKKDINVANVAKKNGSKSTKNSSSNSIIKLIKVKSTRRNSLFKK